MCSYSDIMAIRSLQSRSFTAKRPTGNAISLRVFSQHSVLFSSFLQREKIGNNGSRYWLPPKSFTENKFSVAETPIPHGPSILFPHFSPTGASAVRPTTD